MQPANQTANEEQDEFHNENRVGTASIKWDFLPLPVKPAYPMWIADMQFPIAREIRQYIQKRIGEHCHLGYKMISVLWKETVQKRIAKNLKVDVPVEAILETSGLVQFISILYKIMTKEGDGILLLTPCYYMLIDVARFARRNVHESKLVEKQGRYYIDFQDLEVKISNQNVKMFIFVSPHNPCGRIWDMDQMQKVYSLCKKYDKILVSDEIYSDQVYNEFHSFLKFEEWGPGKLIVCDSPSKTYNVSNSGTGYGIIRDPEIRKMYHMTKVYEYVSQVSLFSMFTLQACYTVGQRWRLRSLQVFKKNYQFLVDFCKHKLPELQIYKLEASYLVLADFARYGIKGSELEVRMMTKGVMLYSMKNFFVEKQPDTTLFRINIACDQEFLQKCMEKVVEAIEGPPPQMAP